MFASITDWLHKLAVEIGGKSPSEQLNFITTNTSLAIGAVVTISIFLLKKSRINHSYIYIISCSIILYVIITTSVIVVYVKSENDRTVYLENIYYRQAATRVNESIAECRYPMSCHEDLKIFLKQIPNRTIMLINGTESIVLMKDNVSVIHSFPILYSDSSVIETGKVHKLEEWPSFRQIDGNIIEGGLSSPLGARSIYVVNGKNSSYIHGIRADDVRFEAISGSITLHNEHIITLYSHVEVGYAFNVINIRERVLLKPRKVE